MKMWIVEEVTLDAPDFAVHLAPFGAWLNPNLHRFHLELAFAGLSWLSGGRDEPLFTLLIQILLAIEGNRNLLDPGDELVDFAFGEIEFGQH